MTGMYCTSILNKSHYYIKGKYYMASKFGMNFASLLSGIDAVNTKKDFSEDNKNYWKLTKDKEGNGSAIIRFLPSKNLEDFPFVRMYSHAFKDPTTQKWYIENSLSTIGQLDYIAEVNRELWNTGIDENKKITQRQKRKLQYISNILVVKDPANPENNGKVFLFKYGKTIFDKIVAAAKPEPVENEDGEMETAEAVNAFDPIEGAAFSLKQTIVEKFPNFDGSTFLKRKPLFDGDDEKIEELFNGLYDINLEIAEDKFKTYEELKQRFLVVTGEVAETPKGKNKGKAPAAPKNDVEEVLDEMEGLAKETPKATSKAKTKVATPMPTMDDAGDDDEFFKSLID
jgi:hypothetical protein